MEIENKEEKRLWDEWYEGNECECEGEKNKKQMESRFWVKVRSRQELASGWGWGVGGEREEPPRGLAWSAAHPLIRLALCVSTQKVPAEDGIWEDLSNDESINKEQPV